MTTGDKLIYDTLCFKARIMFDSFRAAGYTPRECLLKLSCAGY